MSWIQTSTGRKFYPLSPNDSDVSILDIARALSMQCRFGGHVRRFYSVAEHSVHVSNHVSRENALWGLLHHLLETPPEPWGYAPEPLTVSLYCWCPVEAEQAFLSRFSELAGAKP